MKEANKLDTIGKWIKFNELSEKYFEVKDEYEINVLTKRVRNSKTGHILDWIDTGNSTVGKVISLNKDNGKNSNYHYTQVSRLCRLYQ